MTRTAPRLALLWSLVFITFASTAHAEPRTISADGAITETIAALGAADQLVAVDTTSHYPPRVVNKLPKVGYLRALPLEGILSLKPTRLITTEEAGPDKTLRRIENAGVSVFQLPVARTPEAAMERIRRVGDLVNRERQAQELTQTMAKRIKAIRQTMKGKAQARVLVLLAAGNRGLMLAGQDTSADALLASLGLENALQDVSGYKPASRESFLAAAPDAIVIAEANPGQFAADDWPALRKLDAWNQGHHLSANAMLLLGFGPRLPKAMAEVASVVPQAKATADAH
ncbi:heme/hemin ABC transporter substrate-binding protein [Halomonadaceae bacterium KBTZ08]